MRPVTPVLLGAILKVPPCMRRAVWSKSITDEKRLSANHLKNPLLTWSLKLIIFFQLRVPPTIITLDGLNVMRGVPLALYQATGALECQRTFFNPLPPIGDKRKKRIGPDGQYSSILLSALLILYIRILYVHMMRKKKIKTIVGTIVFIYTPVESALPLRHIVVFSILVLHSDQRRLLLVAVDISLCRVLRCHFGHNQKIRLIRAIDTCSALTVSNILLQSIAKTYHLTWLPTFLIKTFRLLINIILSDQHIKLGREMRQVITTTAARFLGLLANSHQAINPHGNLRLYAVKGKNNAHFSVKLKPWCVVLKAKENAASPALGSRAKPTAPILRRTAHVSDSFPGINRMHFGSPAVG